MGATKAAKIKAQAELTTKAERAEDARWRTCLCGMSRKLREDDAGVLRWADHARYVPGIQPDGRPGRMSWCEGSGTEPPAPPDTPPPSLFTDGDS